MSSKPSDMFVQIKDAVTELTPDEQEQLYVFLQRLLGHNPSGSVAPPPVIPLTQFAQAQSCPSGPLPDKVAVPYEPDVNGSGSSGKPKTTTGDVVRFEDDMVDDASSVTIKQDPHADDDEEDDDAPCMSFNRPVKQERVVSVDDPDWDESLTDFNPDTAKNVLQQYYQTFVHPSMTPTYIRGVGYSTVQFQISRDGPQVTIKGYGKRAIEEEKNAALRAIVYLEKNNPRFRTLRLPANARIQKTNSGFGPAIGSSGLTELNSANFLFHCRDVGVLASVDRKAKDVFGGGFSGCTTVVVSNGRVSQTFTSPMYGRKKDAQNAADLMAAEWVVNNLHVTVPSSYISM